MASTNIKMLNRTGNNEQSDECYTPEEALLPLLPSLDKSLTYYECASGKSQSISNFLMSRGIVCISSYEKDFLKDDIPDYVDVIITNPPYSKKDAFIKRCYDIGKPFALLLPLTALQGAGTKKRKGRNQMYHENGIEVLVLKDRIDFTGGGAPHFAVGWFSHGILPEPLIFVQ